MLTNNVVVGIVLVFVMVTVLGVMYAEIDNKFKDWLDRKFPEN